MVMAQDRFFEERKKKLDDLKQLGVDPYPYSFNKKHSTVEVLEKFSSASENKSQETVTLAGRIMNKRKMGKAAFAHLQDQEGKIQFYLKEEDNKDNFDIFRKTDLGDWVGIEGNVFRTKLGEISVYVTKLTFLAKSFHPFPEKFHGLQDTDIRFRKRYLDLNVNPRVKEIFRLRSKIVQEIRNFLTDKGFLDVEIPTLQTVYGGAEARPFKTHINAWDMDLFLSISPELHLKRLIVGGFEKVFTIGKNFRNEDADKTHNPEFTMMECYWAFHEYNDMMKLVEDLWTYVMEKTIGTTKIEYEGKNIDFKKPWKRMTVAGSLKELAKVDVEELSEEQLIDLVNEHKIDYEGELDKGRAIQLLFEELVEDKLIQPTFIYDYPSEASPLSKEKRGNPELTEKFEPYVNGWEVGNGYSELNDPFIQKSEFEKQVKRKELGESEAHEMDEDYVEALEYGMPPTTGFGLGIDRMVILLTGAESLREVLLFPTMKPENKE